jgi:flagellar basal-body rod protein FlgC
MDLVKSIRISAAGMQAQGTRLRVIAENLANSDLLADRPGESPYRRKLVTFKNVLDRQLQVNRVRIDKFLPDRSEFTKRYEPSHPAADAKGYVEVPNVKPLIEMMDMREAQRSYEANLSVIEVSKRMLLRTIDLLR